MKKLLSIFAVAIVFTFFSKDLTAQTEQGALLAGASSNLSFTSLGGKNVDDRQNNFDLGLKGGYFLIDNLAAGLNIGFNSMSVGDISSSLFSIGPFARYYFGGTFYAGAGFDFASQSVNEGDNLTGSLISFEAGYPIFIGGETVAIEPSLNYGIGGGDSLKDTNIFGIQVGVFLYFE